MKTSDQGNINWRNREMKLRDQEIIKEYLTYYPKTVLVQKVHKSKKWDCLVFKQPELIDNQLRNEINKKSFVPTI